MSWLENHVAAYIYSVKIEVGARKELSGSCSQTAIESTERCVMTNKTWFVLDSFV